MSLSKNDKAYNDCRILFDEALASEKGIKIPYKDRAEAVYQRLRFNQYRSITRNQYKEYFPVGDPSHGRSPYEALILRIPKKGSPNDHILYIEPIVVSTHTFEVIT